MIDEPATSGNIGGFFSYLPQILWQRRLFVILPFIVCVAFGVVVAMLVTPVYRSRATLLVEQQQMPTELVGNAYAGMIERRIARIQQQLLSAPQLIEAIKKFDLYPEERRTRSLAEVAGMMRGSAALAPARAEFARDDRSDKNMAFEFTFDYREPAKAQAVAQHFVDKLLSLEIATAANQAVSTAAFLQQDVDRLSTEISRIEGQVEAIKRANGTTLSNAGSLLMPSAAGYDSQIASMERENAQLAAKLSSLTGTLVRDPIVAAAAAALASAEAVYGDNHPDVVRARQRLLEAQRNASQGGSPSRGEADAIRAQIAANREMIQSLAAARAQEQRRTSATVSAQSRAPLITEQIAQLQARADQYRQLYQAAATKLMGARAAVRMDAEQKGERLTVLDKPQLPSSPLKPARALALGGAMFLGLILGFVSAIAYELIKRPIRGVSGVVAATGAEPLIVIPQMEKYPKTNRRAFSLGSRWLNKSS
jgi:succinoglycan biosynthesis transport protein ExoP